MLQLSQEHGVNPAIPKCFYCMKDKNELILAGRLKDDAEAPQGMVWDMNPCQECEELMAQGIILISVRDGEMEKVEAEYSRAYSEWETRYRSDAARKRNPFNHIPNPWRTGGWIVVKDGFIMDALNEDAAAHIMHARWAFVPDEAWDALGFPRDEEIAPQLEAE